MSLAQSQVVLTIPPFLALLFLKDSVLVRIASTSVSTQWGFFYPTHRHLHLFNVMSSRWSQRPKCVSCMQIPLSLSLFQTKSHPIELYQSSQKYDFVWGKKKSSPWIQLVLRNFRGGKSFRHHLCKDILFPLTIFKASDGKEHYRLNGVFTKGILENNIF